jgi:hypothetical protein
VSLDRSAIGRAGARDRPRPGDDRARLVWIDLSGWSPTSFPPIAPDRRLADFERAGFRDEVRPLILKENAVRLLGPG